MKQIISCLTGIAMAMAPSFATVAAAATIPPAGNASTPFAKAALTCPAGTHWENAGYVHGGRWRAAHCAADKLPNY